MCAGAQLGVGAGDSRGFLRRAHSLAASEARLTLFMVSPKRHTANAELSTWLALPEVCYRDLLSGRIEPSHVGRHQFSNIRWSL